MNVLITGGTGLVGRHLTELLLKKGYQVSYLSREKAEIPGVKVFQWDIDNGYVEPEALKNIDYVVHLAGAGIADKRWTEQRKEEIINSRIKPIRLLNQYLKIQNTRIRAFISASAIGYYGANTGDARLDESGPTGKDFLADCTRLWEEETRKFTQADRLVSIRIGQVLSTESGILPKLATPVKFGMGSPLGSGRQWISWIHIEDLCHLYLQSIENDAIQGPYNAVSPAPVRNRELVETIAGILKRPVWLPNVPSFILKLIFGELADAILGGSYIINKRMDEELAFQYRFPTLIAALKDLLK